MKDNTFNVRVVYEPRQIRHIAIQCPECKKWFHGRDILEYEEELIFTCDIVYAHYLCPLCNTRFGCDTEINEENVIEFDIDYPKVYEGCLEKKVSWK